MQFLHAAIQNIYTATFQKHLKHILLHSTSHDNGTVIRCHVNDFPFPEFFIVCELCNLK